MTQEELREALEALTPAGQQKVIEKIIEVYNKEHKQKNDN